jgi:hypothetical protein
VRLPSPRRSGTAGFSVELGTSRRSNVDIGLF